MKSRSAVSAVLPAVFAFCCFSLGTGRAAPAQERPEGAQAAAIVERHDFVFAERGDLKLGVDVAHPPVSAVPNPIVVCIHGGGWRGGNRQAYRGLIRELAGKGYVAATISYRLTTVAPWPAQLEDVRDGLTWVRQHAAEFGGDPVRIGAMGHSAGGHLSLMLGALSDREKNPETSVQAVVNFFGPTDMRSGRWPDGSRQLIEHLAGGPYETKQETHWAMSPVTHLSRGDAPVLTFHGTGDPIVPYEQAQLFHRELDRLGVPNRLDLLDGRSHGWGGEDQARTTAETLKFFHLYLRGSDLPLVTVEDFEYEGDAWKERWEVTDSAAWKIEGEPGRRRLRLFQKESSYKPEVRSPLHIALLKGAVVGDFVLDVTLRSTITDYGHRDLCLFFGHQGPAKFYYVHFGKKADDHANSIFLVDGAPRVSIARERAVATDWDDAWHRVRVVRTVEDGRILVYFDDMGKPVMCAVDKTFTQGRVGVGSFDDTGDFDEVRLRGTAVSP